MKIDEKIAIMKESDVMGIIEGSPAVKKRPRTSAHFIDFRKDKQMAAKDVRFGDDARQRMLRGVDILLHARHTGPKGRTIRHEAMQRRITKDGVTVARDRTFRQIREHGRADGARGRLEEQRYRG